MGNFTEKLKLRELEIVDENDQPRIRLSVDNGRPAIQLLQENGAIAGHIEIDKSGYPNIQLLSTPDKTLSLRLEVDSKGMHLKFDHQNGASNYLFLNNAGTSGLVMIDSQSRRRFAATVTAQGEVNIDSGNED
nr:hypothetical protein [Acinetobacter sp. Marseille-Q1620]